MDFPEALHLLQAPQWPGPERLPFKNLSNASSPQRHLPLKSPTHGHICFKLVTKPRTGPQAGNLPTTTDHHRRRQQLEPAVTHQRPPGQPRGITESSTEPEIDAALPKIVISELTTRSAGNMEPPSRTWQRGMYIPTHGPNNFPSGRPCRRRRGRTYSAQRHQNWPRLARPEGCCDIRPYLCDGRGLD